MRRGRAISALLLFVLLLAGCGAPQEEGRAPGAPEETNPEGTTSAAMEEVASAPAPSSRVLASISLQAAPQSIEGNSAYIDDPSTNGDPDAFVTVTQATGPEGGDYRHPIGVWYDRYRDGGRWAVYNQDEAAVPEGARFEVGVLEGDAQFVHRVIGENTEGGRTYLDDRRVNGDPEADLAVTQNWNPGGGGGTYNRHFVGVEYDEDRDRWAIFNRDGSDLPEGAAFNVLVEDGVEGKLAQAPPETNGGAVDAEGFPEYRDFFAENEDAEVQQPDSGGGSAGAIPNVKPYNFGRDPGGPEDKTMYLSVPKIGLEGVPIYDSTSEEDLRASAVHVPATGFPWQDGANVYIAGHRIGFPGTGSDRVFFDLDLLGAGDEILLTDAAGDTYVYRVTEQRIVGPENVEVMDADDDGKSIITLQTCTLPDYAERLVVQGELVESSA